MTKCLTRKKCLVIWQLEHSCVTIDLVYFMFCFHSHVITLICTRHAYLESSHIRFPFFQITAEQLFLKTSFIKAHMPYSITACMYMLADPKPPACTYKSRKKGKLPTKHTTLGELTKPSDHAWPKVCPNT
jgi:hypothetical protein